VSNEFEHSKTPKQFPVFEVRQWAGGAFQTEAWAKWLSLPVRDNRREREITTGDF
jgi:hypothetical protein